MFNQFRSQQHEKYLIARQYLIENYQYLIALENFISEEIFKVLNEDLQDIISDYNEATYLYPFWQNYPPDERGRKPRGDQFPWIEVGEHAVGVKICRTLEKHFKVRDVGLPTGTDQRVVLQSDKIAEITNNLTKYLWLFLDIKSVGPRDDFDHTVLSHNQVSGDGLWLDPETGIKNSILEAIGKRQKHSFHCSLPPLYILSDGSIVPVVIIAIKPIYQMLSLVDPVKKGQPLNRITIASLPNGLLLLEKPGYIKQFPGLFFPGKDDKEKNPLKLRCRISFSILKSIADWRVKEIQVP